MNTHNPNDFRYPRPPFRRRTSARFDRVPLACGRCPATRCSSGEHEIGIEHHGALYRLKITRQGKLILNK